MGSNLQHEDSYGGKIISALPDAARHKLFGVDDCSNTNNSLKPNRSPKSKKTGSELLEDLDNDFTPIKNTEVLRSIRSPSHPMKMRSKPKKRTLNFCEEYLGNLDDYDFTDYMLNDNNPTIKRNNRKKKVTSDKKRQCEGSATSPQSITTSKCSVTLSCNTDYKSNQCDISDAKNCSKTSTINNKESFQISSNARKRKQANSCKKTFKIRKIETNPEKNCEPRSTIKDSGKHSNIATSITSTSQSLQGRNRSSRCSVDSVNSSWNNKHLLVDLNTVTTAADNITECIEPLMDAHQTHLNDLKNITVDQCSLDKKASFSTDEYANSPDSGFVSESSSAASPSCENIDEFFNNEKVKSEWEVTKSSSLDSGVVILNNRRLESDGALNLCQETVKAAEKLKREAEKRAEDEVLKLKYQCKWMNCPKPFDPRSSGDLHNHLVETHVRHIKSKFCCKWKACKYFDKTVRKESWLQWHVLDHSGEKPFKCIVNGCDASFVSRHGLSRHVNSHYTEVTLPKAKVGTEVLSAKLIIRRRKIQNERKALANLHDCMDNHTLEHMRRSLLVHENQTQLQQSIFGERMQLQPEILGRKMNDGKPYVLVSWHPNNILTNEWIEECKLNEVASVNRNRVFASQLNDLQSLFRYTGQRPSHRRRK